MKRFGNCLKVRLSLRMRLIEGGEYSGAVACLATSIGYWACRQASCFVSH